MSGNFALILAQAIRLRCGSRPAVCPFASMLDLLAHGHRDRKGFRDRLEQRWGVKIVFPLGVVHTRDDGLLDFRPAKAFGSLGQLNEFEVAGFAISLGDVNRKDLSQKERLRLIALLYEGITQNTLLLRPGRTEPRAVKRRPKNYQRLTQPRHEMQVIKHRNRYRKSNAKCA